MSSDGEKHWRWLRDFELPLERFRDNDNKLTEFVTNKRVVLVGPAPYMDEAKLGKKIDSYDVVVRLSTGGCLPAKAPKIFGSKTDVIYTSAAFRRHFRRAFPPNFAKPIFYVDLNQIVTETIRAGKDICSFCAKKIVVNDVIDQVEAQLDNNPEKHRYVQCHRECNPDNKRYAQGIDKSRTTVVISFLNQFNYLARQLVPLDRHDDEQAEQTLIGMHAVLDLLRRQPKELQVYGFDFYAQLPRKRIIKNNMADKRKEPVEKDAIYSKSYDVVEGSLTACHKDTNRSQLRLFIAVLQNYKKTFKNTVLSIDDHLQKIIAENARERLREQLQRARVQRRLKNGVAVRIR